MAIPLTRRLTRISAEFRDALTNPGYNARMRMRHIHEYAIRRITRQKRIKGLEIQNTYRCNARCHFCSMGDSVNLKRDMDPAVFQIILDQAIEEGVLLFVFLGGEALVDRHLYSYLDLCWKAGIKTEIQSNGTLLTENHLLKLKQAHVQGVSVTLHGTTAAEHDSVYQIEGSFDRLRHALVYARTIGLPMSLKTLYCKRTDDDGTFARILALARETGHPLNVNPMMPVGNGFEDSDRLDAESVKRFRTLMTRESGVTSHVFNNGEPTGCFAGKDYFCISPDGDLMPCFFMPLSIGKIQTTSLREAHKLALQIPIFRERYPMCYVAESAPFYEKCLVPLHQRYQTLPVNVLEHPEVIDMLKQFDMSTL